MIEGIIQYLLSQNQTAKDLLDNYVFKIVPMVNSDGVIHGNTRAELCGMDPNRKWQDPSPTLQPIIFALKKAIFRDIGNIKLFLDLHSHSRKLNTFFYGNYVPRDLQETVRLFPLMASNID